MNLHEAIEHYVGWRQARCEVQHGAQFAAPVFTTPMAKTAVMPSPKRRSRTFLLVP